MEAIPQFGEPQPGLTYPDRPAAFGIAARDGLIAVVRIETPAETWFDLPGGGREPGETDEDAVVREFGEEAGLTVTPRQAFARADQYFLNRDHEPWNIRAVYFDLALTGEDPALKIEADHSLIWLDPHEAVRTLRRDSHAWAVAAWLRRVRG